MKPRMVLFEDSCRLLLKVRYIMKTKNVILLGIFLVSVVIMAVGIITPEPAPAAELTDAEMAKVYGGDCGLLCLPNGYDCPWENFLPAINENFALLHEHPPTRYSFDVGDQYNCQEYKWACFIDFTSWCEEKSTACSNIFGNFAAHCDPCSFTMVSVDQPCMGDKPDCDWGLL